MPASVPRSLALALAAAVALAAPLAAPLAAQRVGSGGTVSYADARQLGSRYLEQVIQRHGRNTDRVVNADVGLVIERLVGAAGEPRHDLLWAVVNDTSVNAAAMPGSVMFVNVGVTTLCRGVTDTAAVASAGERRERYLGCLAAVIGHEYGHVTLGHPDSSLAQAVRARGFRAGDAERLDRRVRELLADLEQMERLRRSREQELAADRIGGLYLLRAGWQIQDAMNLFRRMELGERAEADANLAGLGWFRDHPRGVVREAELEQLRADVRRDQARLDDALLLVQNDVLLDSAVALFDHVLADLPQLPVAQHGRAAALHQMWLDATPVSRLRVRSVTPVYTTFFAGGIRGAGDAALLDSARQGYERALRLRPHAYTYANLAVLEGYAGRLDAARAHADSARRLAPADTMVQLNRSAVLLLTGDAAGARRILEPLAAARADASPIVRWNLAAARLAMGDTTGARLLLQRFARDEDGWGAEARRLLGGRSGPRDARAPGREDGAGGKAGAGERAGGSAARDADGDHLGPMVAGIRLGMTLGEVMAVLGEPDRHQESRIRSVLRYEARGLAIVIAHGAGVAAIVVRQRSEEASVDGVRIGDPLKAAFAAWGRGERGSDGALYFPQRGYTLAVAAETDGSIGEIGIASARR